MNFDQNQQVPHADETSALPGYLRAKVSAMRCFSYVAMLITSLNATCIAQSGSIWYGELDAKTRVFRFVIEQTPATEADTKNTGTLTSLDEGSAKFALDDFSLDDAGMHFKLKATKAAFEGKLDAASQVVSGTWKQHGAELGLEFKKVETIPIDAPQEIWRGSMKTGFQNLEMQVRVYETNDAKKSYFVDSVSQKAGGFMANVEIAQGEFRMKIPALQATYSGRMDETEQEIAGKWKQLISLDLTLKRVDKVAQPSTIERKRPQTPKPPFAYEARDIVFRNEVDGIDLAGTLTIPKQGKSHPLAILISGSGPQDRDETLLEHKPFWVIADYLSRQGVAVLRYDDRGTGKSGGIFDSATTKDFARDTQAAVALARSLPEIDSNRIGLIGHSEGGLIAPLVAAEDQKIAWIILLAGPGVNGEQILYSQGQLIIAAEGGSAASQAQQLKLQKAVFQAIKDTDSKLATRERIRTIVDQLVAEKDDVSDEDKAALQTLVEANWIEMKKPWFRFFVEHEPGPVLEKVGCPVLALSGALDMQVDPKLNLSKIAEHLKAGGNTRFVTRECEGLNHLFQTCKTGGISEYQEIEETFSPVALNAMLEWIQSL